MADIKALLANPEFKTLSLEGQKKALARLDPELGGMSDTGYLKFVYQVAPPVGTEKLVGGLPSPIGPPLSPVKSPVLPRAPMDPFSMDLDQSTPVSTFGGTKEPIGTSGHTPWTMEMLAAPPSTARRNPRTGLPMPPGSGPLKMLDWTTEGTGEAAQGVAQMSDWDAEGTSQTPKPTAANQLLGGASKVYRGSMEAAAPALLPYGAITLGPGAFLTGLAAGGAAGAGTEAGLNALHVSPEKSAAAGDVAGTLFAIGTSKLYGPVKVGYNFITDAYRRAKYDPKLARIIARGLKIPGIAKAELIGEIYDHLFPQPPAPKPFSPGVPSVRPQGQGLPGFPKPPGEPGPKVYPAPGVTPQGRGLSGFPKPPGPPEPWAAPRVTFKTPVPEKPFSPGMPPPPRFKPEAPTEKPFRPGVPPFTKQGWTRTATEGEATSGASKISPTDAQVEAELARMRAQQPPPREPIVPRESGAASGNAPHEPIRPEDTNPAATHGGKEPLASTSTINWQNLPENQRGRFLNSEFHAAGKDIEGVGTGTRGRPSGNAVAKDLFGPKATWMGDPGTAISHARMDAITDFMTNKGRVPTGLDLDSGVFKDPDAGLRK